MNLPTLHQNQVMSSREIAEMTRKDHSHVLRDIRVMLAELYHSDDPKMDGIDSKEVYLAGIKIEKRPDNGQISAIHLPKRDALILTSGYSITQRARIIDRWQELESQQIPKTLPEALRLAADLAERNAQLENKIEVDAPKVQFAEAVRRMDGACKLGDFGKVVGIGRNTLFKLLRHDEYLMGDNMPYQRHIDSGLFVVIEQTPFVDRDGNAHPAFSTMITGKGQVVIEKKYRKSWRTCKIILLDLMYNYMSCRKLNRRNV